MRGMTSSKYSSVDRTNCTVCCSDNPCPSPLGSSLNPAIVSVCWASGLRIQVTKSRTALWMISWISARWSAESSAKNGSSTSSARTASVDSLPEYRVIRLRSASETGRSSAGAPVADRRRPGDPPDGSVPLSTGPITPLRGRWWIPAPHDVVDLVQAGGLEHRGPLDRTLAGESGQDGHDDRLGVGV